MRWVGLLLCWAGVLLPLLSTIHVFTESVTVAAGEVGGRATEQTTRQSVESLMVRTQVGLLLFCSGIVVLLVNWRYSRIRPSESDDHSESR